MKGSKCTAVFTNHALLKTCLQATSALGVPEEKVYILGIPNDAKVDEGPRSVESLISEGASMSPISSLAWDNDEPGNDRIAFLCPTSGTSGMQVG